MTPAIQISKLDKTFQKQKRALDCIDLQVNSGEIVALIGPSGSGKSTLLRHISGLEKGDRHSEGEVLVYDDAVQKSGRLLSGIRRKRARIGYIFQQFNLVNRMTVRGNVLLGMLGRIPRWRGTLGIFTQEEKALALNALKRVGMDEFAAQRADKLSGGQQQRVAIARALVQQADIILADEPIASLDPESAKNVMDQLADINRQDNKTVVVTLHQVEYARKYCQRVVALRLGKVHFDGPVAELTDEVLKNVYGSSEALLTSRTDTDTAQSSIPGAVDYGTKALARVG
ncbi:MAG: phosphonate ABC transporter ATP-binding protein [Pseudomonadales bacterium]|uniref:Phosphonate ABC transporter ATP-binding subunit n=1 Tax=Oleiphilus messinensis TaxID=141451 RepID=A0A1Y0IIS7_9GAMM|nr:phosphonate ABC transporter ATP-binding protein [Oleiphilus messinensis]ARU59425.1 phosphonate ABC transporter ATP-binding subunit [Oleiphilus messinensis]MCG8610844.1 phosphonate ABC transporter ATP-binding protein [Pseudomonadales bacterium]